MESCKINEHFLYLSVEGRGQQNDGQLLLQMLSINNMEIVGYPYCSINHSIEQTAPSETLLQLLTLL